jgi:four helix bundle protein
MEINSHRDLKVWRLAMTLAERTYELTKQFPSSELYGMTSQMRRAAVSIAANRTPSQ